MKWLHLFKTGLHSQAPRVSGISFWCNMVEMLNKQCQQHNMQPDYVNTLQLNDQNSNNTGK